jgi:hypothetical protein
MPSRRPSPSNRQKTDPLGIFVAAVVTIVWAISVTVDSFSGTFAVSPAIHGVMLAVVGAILGHGWVLQRRNGNDDGGDS